MEDLSSKVLETIKQKSIKPRPKWYFLARNLSLWGLTILTTVFGGLAFSLVILFAYFQRFGFNHLRPTGKFLWLLGSVPYAWLLVFALLVGVIYYDLKHLKKNYKYPPYLLVLASLLGSVILGFFISSFGIHRIMNAELSRRVPFYGQVFDARRPAWGRPADGSLAGKIASVNDDFIVLEDFNHQEWQVIFHDETTEDDSVLIVPGQMVVMHGNLDAPGIFSAQEILPWEGCRKNCNLIKPKLRPRPAMFKKDLPASETPLIKY